MKKYTVAKRTTELNNRKDVMAAYEGCTLDEKMNHLNVSAEEMHEFTDESEARAFLAGKSNDYFYNGDWGRVTEWWIEEEEVDEDGDPIGDMDMDICPNGNFAEFDAMRQEM